ncbi:MAG: TIM barrel protein [Oceanospirillaceae bacterium]
MSKFSANISTLFTEAPLIERFSLAAAAGFSSVEIQFPYVLEKSAIKEQLRKHNLTLSLINLPAGSLDKGELGIACLPDRTSEFKQAVSLAAQYATFLEVPKVNCLAGIKPADLTESMAEKTLLKNLNYAASYFQNLDILLLIEAINTEDIENFFLSTSTKSINIINQLNGNNVKFQYDCYHMQIMEGNLIKTITQNINDIGHIQIADVPGRGEPNSGEINFSNIFNALTLLGYTDYIGLEYFPIKDTQNGLAALEQLLNLKGELS